MLFPHSLLASAVFVLVKFSDTTNALHIPRAVLALSPQIAIHSRVASSGYNDDGIAPMAVSTASTVSAACSADGNVYPPYDVCGSMSFSAALAFTVIFGILTIAHAAQAIYYSKPYTYPLLTSTLWTFLSFLLLTLSHSHSHPLLSLLSSNLLLIAPLWLTTYLHLVLPYLSNHFLPTRSLLGVRAPVLRALSLLLTVPVAALQVVGMMRGVAESDDGRMWFALGVVLQGLAMVIFVAMLGMLHREVTGLESVGVLETGKREWRKVVWTAYGNAGLVLIILLSRLIHLLSHSPSSSKQHIPIYILEVIPLLLATLSWNVLHPGRTLVGEERMERLWGVEFRYTRGVGSDTTASGGDEDGLGTGIGGKTMRGDGMGDEYEDGDIDECERGDADRSWMCEVESRTRYYSSLRDEI